MILFRFFYTFVLHCTYQFMDYTNVLRDIQHLSKFSFEKEKKTIFRRKMKNVLFAATSTDAKWNI